MKPKHSAGEKSSGKDPLEGQGCIPAPRSPLTWALLLPVPSWALPPSRARVHPAGKGRGCAGSSPPAPPGTSDCQASASPAEQNFNGVSRTGSSQRSQRADQSPSERSTKQIVTGSNPICALIKIPSSPSPTPAPALPFFISYFAGR